MDIQYKQAFNEVIEILNHSDISIIEKIPQKFIDFLYENMDKDYKCNIDFFDNNWENTVKEETRYIIGLIYRDYICSCEERTYLIKEQIAEEKKIEEELIEKYNIDSLFKKNDNKLNKEITNTNSLIEKKDETWFKKLYNILLKIFKRKV